MGQVKDSEGRVILTLVTNGNVLSGRVKGKAMRRYLELDIRDNDKEKYLICVPELFAITASYFLECFGRSVKALGRNGFCNKYRFDCVNESIKELLETGIDSAGNIKWL